MQFKWIIRLLLLLFKGLFNGLLIQQVSVRAASSVIDIIVSELSLTMNAREIFNKFDMIVIHFLAQ